MDHKLYILALTVSNKSKKKLTLKNIDISTKNKLYEINKHKYKINTSRFFKFNLQMITNI